MQIKNAFLIVFILLLIQCKTADVGQGDSDNVQPTSFILLLSDDLSPADLEIVKSMKVESMKRISRSQNQWMVKVVEDQAKVVTLLEKLKEDKRVSEVSIEGKTQKSDNLKNTKSGKSGSIKN